MGDSGQISSLTPGSSLTLDTKFALFTRTVTCLQKQCLQTCDILSDNLGNEGDDFFGKVPNSCVADLGSNPTLPLGLFQFES